MRSKPLKIFIFLSIRNVDVYFLIQQIKFFPTRIIWHNTSQHQNAVQFKLAYFYQIASGCINYCTISWLILMKVTIVCTFEYIQTIAWMYSKVQTKSLKAADCPFYSTVDIIASTINFIKVKVSQSSFNIIMKDF